MKDIEVYRQHARECESLAAKMKNEEDKTLMREIAEAWETLANEREVMLRRRMAS